MGLGRIGRSVKSLVGAVFVVEGLFAVVVGWCATAIALRRVVRERGHAGSLVGAVLVEVVAFGVVVEWCATTSARCDFSGCRRERASGARD